MLYVSQEKHYKQRRYPIKEYNFILYRLKKKLSPRPSVCVVCVQARVSLFLKPVLSFVLLRFLVFITYAVCWVNDQINIRKIFK